MPPPQGFDHLRGSDDPSDAQAGQPVSFGHTVGADYLVILSPEAGSLIQMNLGAAVDFIGMKPSSGLLANLHDMAHLRRSHDGSPRVVVIHAGNQLGLCAC